MASQTSFVCTVSEEQAGELRDLMEPKGWTFDDAPYARWKAKLHKTTVVAYESGKLTVQGRGTPDFVQFLLEPYVLKEARFGYEHLLAEEETPEMFEPHAGIDESGKGDYFGPLIVAACFVDRDSARELLAAGVVDSKRIGSARRVSELARTVRTLTAERFALVTIGPEAYNRLYERFGNLNRMLAWAHAQALENLLEKVPQCPRAMSDQFARKEVLKRALKERGRRITLEQKPRGEADVAVAAASILARAEFVRRLDELATWAEEDLPKGAGPAVRDRARRIAAKGGRALLGKLAKLHFRITENVLETDS